MANAQTEVAQAAQGGLPQLDFTTYSEQVAWLFLTFIVLYVLISRVVLPRVDRVLEEREEKIAGDLDQAERLRTEAEEIKTAYEARLAEARSGAQKAALAAKEKVQAEFSKAQNDIDARLLAEAEAAEARIQKTIDEALESLDVVAEDVAATLVSKLTHAEADNAKISKAVKTALAETKGA